MYNIHNWNKKHPRSLKTEQSKYLKRFTEAVHHWPHHGHYQTHGQAGCCHILTCIMLRKLDTDVKKPERASFLFTLTWMENIPKKKKKLFCLKGKKELFFQATVCKFAVESGLVFYVWGIKISSRNVLYSQYRTISFPHTAEVRTIHNSCF